MGDKSPAEEIADSMMSALGYKRAPSPADEMRSISARLNEMAAKAKTELGEESYWEGGTFATGIDNAVGGPCGELAAMFSPDLATAVANWLYRTARQWDHEVRGHLHDTCDGAVGEDCYCFVGAMAVVEAWKAGDRG